MNDLADDLIQMYFFFWNTSFECWSFGVKGSCSCAYGQFFRKLLPVTLLLHSSENLLRLAALPTLMWQQRLKKFTANVSTKYQKSLNHHLLAFL